MIFCYKNTKSRPSSSLQDFLWLEISIFRIFVNFLEFEIPTAVSARITEWFNRNDAAESRASEASTATDSNLDDIREKAKNRIKGKGLLFGNFLKTGV